MNEKKLSRRDFLRMGALTAAGAALAGCGPQVVKETVEVEKEVTKIVKEKVEKEKVVTATPPPRGTVPILFWFQAENHEPEYKSRIPEFNEKFNIDMSYEIMSRDAMNKKFPAALMSGSGFPDIIEMNHADVVKYLKGSDEDIPFLSLNEAYEGSPYYGKVLEARFARLSKGGHVYAVPHDVHPLVLLYHHRDWKEVVGIDLAEEVVTWDDYLEACSQVPTEMKDGRPRYALMDCTNCTNLPARMMEKGLWWTDENCEPMLTDPDMKVCVEDWLRFHEDFWVNIDWANQVAMVKEGQVMSQLCPDWLYGIHKQGTAEDKDFLADSPMRVMRIPDFEPDGPHVGTWGGTGCSVPKLSQNRGLAVDVMLYMYFENGKNEMVERWKSIGILPPVEAAWEAPGFHESDPYVGGQDAGGVFIKAAKDMPKVYQCWKTTMVKDAFNEQFSLIWEGELDVEKGIGIADENAHKEIEKAT